MYEMNLCTDRYARMPEYDDEAVENVEADADVSTQAVSDDLQKHFDGEQSTEEHVAVLKDLSQRRRLQPTKRIRRYLSMHGPSQRAS